MKLKGIRGVLLDLSGTLYSGGRRIEGTRRALASLREQGIGYRFLTNTTTKPRSSLKERLEGMGLHEDESWILTPFAAARERLRQDACETVFPLIADEVRGELGALRAVETAPDAVLIGDLGAGFSYDVLNRAFRHLADGARFYALARNRVFESGGELFLDLGPFVQALEYALGRESLCLGKPSGPFFDLALGELGLEPSDVAVVGDDLESDVLGAIDHGMRGILVRTGKFSANLLNASERKPDAVIDSIADLPDLLADG